MKPNTVKRERGILRMVTSYVVTFTLGAMVLTSAILMVSGFRSYQSAVSASLESSARYAADRVERYIGSQTDFLEAATWIEGRTLSRDASDPGFLDGILGFSPAILQLAAVDRADGRILSLASRRSKASALAAGLPFALEASRKAESGKPFLSPAYVDQVTGEILITLGVAPFDRFKEGNVTLVSQLNLKFMWDLIAKLDLETGGRAYIVDSSGALIAYDDPSRVLAHERLSRIPLVAEFVAGRLPLRPGPLMPFNGIEGNSVVGACIPLDKPSWAVVIELPWRRAYRYAIQVLLFSLIAVAAMVCAVYITGAYLARRLSSPILALAGAVSEIGRHDRDGSADKSGPIAVKASGPREVVELASAFNDMAQRLKHDEERFQRLIWNSNDIIAVADRSGVLTYVSASIERIYGYPPKDVVGRKLSAFLFPGEKKTARRAFASLMRAAGAVERAVFRIKAIDGRAADVEMIAVNLIDDPEIRGVMLNFHDVSERIEAEREKAKLQDRLQHAMKMEAVGRLAGGIAHDFNNLLTGIYGSVQLARMDADDPEKVEYYLNEIKKEAESAASLTRQLLAYSRKQPVEARLLDLNALVLDVGGMLKRLIGEDISIEFALGRGLKPVRVDPGLFQQVLVNLSANARDAMPEGGTIVIRTEAVALDEDACAPHDRLVPGEFIRLSVEDSGIGMDPETQRHLFEPFYTTKSLGKGTGLGLAMVYGAVHQSDGAIEVSSEPGKGSVFSILLPVQSGAAEEFNLPSLEGEPLRGSETLLLVEDKPAVMEVTARMLRKLGYLVLEAATGEDALRILGNRKRIDALVTDVTMPGMNGLELAQRAREAKGGLRILFISGYAEDANRKQGAITAIGRFILKPYTIHALAAKVRETLDVK